MYNILSVKTFGFLSSYTIKNHNERYNLNLISIYSTRKCSNRKVNFSRLCDTTLVVEWLTIFYKMKIVKVLFPFWFATFLNVALCKGEKEENSGN